MVRREGEGRRRKEVKGKRSDVSAGAPELRLTPSLGQTKIQKPAGHRED